LFIKAGLHLGGGYFSYYGVLDFATSILVHSTICNTRLAVQKSIKSLIPDPTLVCFVGTLLEF